MTVGDLNGRWPVFLQGCTFEDDMFNCLYGSFNSDCITVSFGPVVPCDGVLFVEIRVARLQMSHEGHLAVEERPVIQRTLGVGAKEYFEFLFLVWHPTFIVFF